MNNSIAKKNKEPRTDFSAERSSSHESWGFLGHMGQGNNTLKSIAANLSELMQAANNNFSFVVDLSTFDYLFVSNSVEQITGYPQAQWFQNGLGFIMAICHPEDKAAIRGIQSRKKEHLHLARAQGNRYKYTYDFRIKHAKGKYIRINVHVVFYNFNENNWPLSALCICNDITALKNSKDLVFEISKEVAGAYEVESIAHIKLEKTLCITPREAEVLRLLANGSSVHEIASLLSISEHTVRDHRKNLLVKNNAKNLNEVISLAWKNKCLD